MRVLVAAFLLASVAPVHAAWLDGPVTVTVAPYRAGDVLRMEARDAWTAVDGKGGAWNATTLAEVEGASEAADRFGARRATEAFRVDLWNATGRFLAARCHRLAGGDEVVRQDLLQGAASWSESWGGAGLGAAVRGRETTTASDFVAAFPAGGCSPSYALARTTFQEGDRVRLGDLFPSSGDEADLLSAPAEAGEFAGRPALTLRFATTTPDGTSASGAIVVADGIPGLVAGSNTWDGPGGSGTYEHALVGFRPGDGAPLAPFIGARLPERPPDGATTAFDRLAIATEGLGLAYSFEEAWTNLRADPRMGVEAWIDAHPEAVLAAAYYDRENGRLAADVEADGAWYVALAEGDLMHAWASYRPASPPGTLPLPGAARPFVNVDAGEDAAWQHYAPSSGPATVVDASTLAAVAERHGVPAPFALVGYNTRPSPDGALEATWTLSQVSTNAPEDSEGIVVFVDAATGGATGIASRAVRHEETGLLALEADRDVIRAAAWPETDVPRVGIGLTAGAVGVAALLALVVKFVLLPLYTRLRRDRLLDHPIRARLYETVRRDPGLHRAAVRDVAGLAEGAARHHLAQLVAHRYVAEIEVDGFVRYFAAGEVPPEVARREAVLRAGSMRRVYDLYAAEPGLTLRDAASRLSLSAPTVYRAKKRLESRGLLPAATVAEVRA